MALAKPQKSLKEKMEVLTFFVISMFVAVVYNLVALLWILDE